MSDLISFDFAIKYILKNRGGYEIIEDFISALLQNFGYPAIKITAPLERESAKEAMDVKGSIVDFAVEDADGNAYLIEVDRAIYTNFIHKACFNTSRLIVDSLPTAIEYVNIKKVFHVSVLYTPLKSLDSHLYHIKSAVNKISGGSKENLEFATNNDAFLKSISVLPEYFVIAVPLFNDQVNTKLDDWLYFIKNNKIREGCTNPQIQEAMQRFSLINMSPEQRTEFFKYSANNTKMAEYVNHAKSEGIEEGWQEGLIEGEKKGKIEGKIEEKFEIAKSLLLMNMEPERIAKATGLSIEEIEKINKSQ